MNEGAKRTVRALAALVALGASAALAEAAPAPVAPLRPPEGGGPIPVAFLLSDGAVMIDFTGPWEVFQDVFVGGKNAFQLYTVAATRQPVRVSGGMQIVPDYTFADAPTPRVVVVPALHTKAPERERAIHEWLRKTARADDLTMSVCNGSFVLAAAGLLDGRSAAAYHNSWSRFEERFPNVHLERGARFVEQDRVATAGGLSSGIDLALHVVERYFGRQVAEETAFEMEYQGTGWKDRNSNAAYVAHMAAKERKSGAQSAGAGAAPSPAISASREVGEIEKVIAAFRESLIEKDEPRYLKLFTASVGWVRVLADQSLQQARAKDPKLPRIKDWGIAGHRDLIHFAVTSKERIEEKFSDVHIDTDGYVATVSFDYSFHEGQVKTNWGREAWALVRTEAGWKIASVVYSVTLAAP